MNSWGAQNYRVSTQLGLVTVKLKDKVGLHELGGLEEIKGWYIRFGKIWEYLQIKKITEVGKSIKSPAEGKNTN